MQIQHRGGNFKSPMSEDFGHHGHVGVGHTHLSELTKLSYVV
jgi:hypothetical protein